MKLTDQERKLFSMLKKEQQKWSKYGKWIFLFTGFFTLTLAIIAGKMTFDLALEPNCPSLLPAIMFPQVYVYATISGMMLGKSIFQFHGDPVKRLVIKLIEDKEK